MQVPEDEKSANGYPPECGNQLTDRDVDESQFQALQVNGDVVTLVPIDVAYDWHQRREARFVDAKPPPPDTGQQEAAPIRKGDSFTVHLKSAGLTEDTPIHVSTPAFEVTRPLGELTSGLLTP